MRSLKGLKCRDGSHADTSELPQEEVRFRGCALFEGAVDTEENGRLRHTAHALGRGGSLAGFPAGRLGRIFLAHAALFSIAVMRVEADPDFAAQCLDDRRICRRSYCREARDQCKAGEKASQHDGTLYRRNGRIRPLDKRIYCA